MSGHSWTGGRLLIATSGVRPAPTTGEDWSTLRVLARADARRYARHPLFLFACGVLLVAMATNVIQRNGGGANPMVATLFIAFLLGVFGFVVAHRLTTSLLRSRELVGTVPVGRQMRTASLCLACLVPAAAAAVVVVFMIVIAAIWTPVGDPVSAHVAWFRDDSALDVLATLIAMGPVAALGGPLLGVAVARWAPFRGSALIAVVTLVFVTALPSEATSPWRLMSAWPILVDEHVNNGNGPVVRSNFVPDVEPVWALFYLLCLCGLAAVAALLRDAGHRRPLLGAGVALAVGAVGFFLLAVS